MFIKAKYFSQCPACSGNIYKDARIWWEPGTKPVHAECHKITPAEMIRIFKETHASGEIVFLQQEEVPGQGPIYSFRWTRKDGKKRIIRYYQNGDRFHEGATKTWIGQRNLKGAEEPDPIDPYDFNEKDRPRRPVEQLELFTEGYNEPVTQTTIFDYLEV